MTLAKVLRDEWVAIPARAKTLADAVRAVLDRLEPRRLPTALDSVQLARDLAEGRRGQVTRLDDRIVAVVDALDGLDEPGLGLAISTQDVAVPPSCPASGAGRAVARAIVVVLVPARASEQGRRILRTVARALREPGCAERVLRAGSAAEIRDVAEFVEAGVRGGDLVEDALVPISYRVYPDTPMSEVLDLMVRRGVRAVPVVGERYQVLGVLTSGDVLGHVVRKGLRDRAGPDDDGAEGERPVVARDVMTRSILCVSEDQSLAEAANAMVKRGVDQIPVTRDGELVGFVTRDSVLKALRSAWREVSAPARKAIGNGASHE